MCIRDRYQCLTTLATAHFEQDDEEPAQEQVEPPGARRSMVTDPPPNAEVVGLWMLRVQCSRVVVVNFRHFLRR